MNTNDAKEYLARREIPQLFEVRHDVRCASTLRTRIVRMCTIFFFPINVSRLVCTVSCPTHDERSLFEYMLLWLMGERLSASRFSMKIAV